jgi:hypothetical protein
MSRLTKSQSNQKKADIAALLAKGIPMASIAAQLHCSLRMVDNVKQGHKGNGNGNVKQSSIDPALLAENAALKEGARELYQTFLKIAENPKQARSILGDIDVEKIDGVVKYL